MKTQLYWFTSGLTNGQLGICPRPRGNDWLEDEIQHFKYSGVDILVSTLEFSEVYELELLEESKYCGNFGMLFLSYPIKDRGVPDSMHSFYGITKEISVELSRGKNVIIHCRQGIGRSSLFAAGVLRHLCTETASRLFSTIGNDRRREVPDTDEQVQWLETWIEMFF